MRRYALPQVEILACDVEALMPLLAKRRSSLIRITPTSTGQLQEEGLDSKVLSGWIKVGVQLLQQSGVQAPPGVAWEPQPAAPPSQRARAMQEDPGVRPDDDPAASAVGLAFEMAQEQDHIAAFQEALDKEELENRAVKTIVSFFRRLRFKLPGSPAKQGGAAVLSEREQFVAQWRQWDRQQRLARFAQCFEHTTAHGLAWFAGTRLLFSQQQLGAASFESTKARLSPPA